MIPNRCLRAAPALFCNSGSAFGETNGTAREVPEPLPGRHRTSPDLTSTGVPWKEEGMVDFLVTGTNPAGHTAAAPMPACKIKPADAEVVAACLKPSK